jgi:hypothetical protein
MPEESLPAAMSHSIAHDCPAPAVIHRLGHRLLLAEWNGPALPSGGRLRVTINGGRARPPFSQITLPRDDAGCRNFLALAAPSTAITKMELREKDGGPVARFVASTRTSSSDPDFDAHALVLGLDGSRRARLTRFLLEVCGPLFRASSDPVFVANVRAVLAEMAPGSGTLSARCALTPEHLFCEGVVPDTLGERLTAVLLTDDGILRAPAPPALLPTSKIHPGRAGVGLVVPNTARRRGTTIVIFGENGLVCRSLVVARRRLPSATEWFSKEAKQRPQHRRFLLEALARGQCGAASAPLLRELRVLSSDGEPQTGTHGPSLRAKAHSIIDCGEGLFISGELIDPHRLIAGIDVERLGVTRTMSIETLALFSCDAERVPGPVDHRGFAAFVNEPDQAAARAPVRITAGLVSGQRIEVGDGPDLLTSEEATEAVLAAIPPEGASAALLSCIGPALQALTRQRLAGPAAVEVKNIGRVPNRPSLSVIIPFAPEPEVLRCRMGVLAVDPEIGDAECLYLVDKAQDRNTAEQLLSDLHAAYGVPCRLVLSERAAAAGAMLDLGRATARGAYVAFLGRTAVPESSGWLGKLINFLKARPQRGIVAAQALHSDHSLLSAGAVVDDESDGGWRLRRLLAGFPRDYAPASVAGRVDAVSPDCFVLSRGLLHELQGRAGSYLLEASAVADLCFQAAARGFEIWRLPEPAVFRLAAPARTETEAQAAARLELDRRLLERCWRELRSGSGAEAGQTQSISPSKVVALSATRKVA